ncbi:MAG: 30S ribosomal protein S9 [Candidatus Kerfeldbacteria bacterium]|nr:30S ribosomal protein S9 [Candidatus Kerfeldbacteria bacterium]
MTNFIYTVGRRKNAVARVRYYHKADTVGLTVNGQQLDQYFDVPGLPKIVTAPLQLMNVLESASITLKVQGGGKIAQAQAARLGIARALMELNPESRSVLKHAGFLSRDPRKKERKKPGLKRARRAPQWSKR